MAAEIEYFNTLLVEAVDDLRATNPPSDPALLAALAAELTQHGFDLKHLTRVVMTSAVYGLSSAPTPENIADRRNYARHYPQRLSPYVLLDAIGAATGTPPKFHEFPAIQRAIQLPNESQQNDFLDIFGRARRDSPCSCETRLEPNLSQVLYVMFSPELQTEIAGPDAAVSRSIKANRSTDDIVTDLYLRTVSRPPSADELRDAAALLDGAGGPATGAAPAAAPPPADPQALARQRQQVAEDLLWTLLNSKEFLFNH